ncbi:MAG: HAMP domain-containing protein, partial [Treponema sp.]|nr:HAMP domain-containing protein [Treponema sp.]
TSVEYDNVFEQVARTTRRNIILTITVLFAAILITWFFSKSISVPIRLLAGAAGEIEQGNFDIQLKAKTKDELGLLTNSFVRMGRGLAERERLKDTFGRFINKDIAEKAMKGELSLGGENKHVTIFFSDIRQFTAISEKLEPHEVVEFLNEYMTKMVKCVNDTHGVVDKFIGDAVMAIWGAPISGGSAAADALNCVRSALMMRAALLDFNKDRGGDKKPIIKIGCGINTGDVVAGQIGSNERMEYTVIGDAVNLASRTEGLNKPLGTDILITEHTYRLIGKALIVEEMPSVEVKGKEKPIRMFAVINMLLPYAKDIPLTGENGPKTLADVRNLLGLTPPDMRKVDLNEDEKKYSIQAS